LRTSDPVIPSAAASEETATTQIVLAFEDNKLASVLFGQYGQNLALIETPRSVWWRSSAAIHVTLGRLARRLRAGPPRAGGAVRSRSSAATTSLRRTSKAPSGRRSRKGSLFDFDPAAARPPSRKSICASVRCARAPPRRTPIFARSSAIIWCFGTGPAGTGKTWLAVAQAIQMFERKEVDRIILSRPAVEAGERLGFLPGDMREKVDPYLRPIYDALHDLMDVRIVERAT